MTVDTARLRKLACEHREAEAQMVCETCGHRESIAVRLLALGALEEAARLYRDADPGDSGCDQHANSSCGECPGCRLRAALAASLATRQEAP